ncbi:MAG: hypothetical protein WBB82_16905 [Limnothrix sp.]
MKIIQSLGTRHISQCLYLGCLLDSSENAVEASIDKEPVTLPDDAEVVMSPSPHDESLSI